MKRSPIAIVLLSFLLAFVHAGFTCVEKTTLSHSETASAWSISSFKPPHTELEIHSLQAGHSVQGSHHFQKLSCPFTCGGNKGGSCRGYQLCPTRGPAPVWTKEYLSHIYPSHNFW